MKDNILKEKVRSNLSVGDEYQNFKLLCNSIGVNYNKYKRGRNKKCFLKKLNRLVSYTHKKYGSYKIVKIYSDSEIQKNEIFDYYISNDMRLAIVKLYYIKDIKINNINMDILIKNGYISKSHKVLNDNYRRFTENGSQIRAYEYTIRDLRYHIQNFKRVYLNLFTIDDYYNYELFNYEVKLNLLECEKLTKIINSSKNTQYLNELPNSIYINGHKYHKNKLNKNRNIAYSNNKYKKTILKYCEEYIRENNSNYYIYKYTNKESDMSYIGQTENLYQRQYSRFLHPQTPFDYVIRAIGLKYFDFEVIDTADSLEEVLELESKYIKEYNSKDFGYNIMS